VFGTDYPTPDGTCIRDYIHVSDLVRVHSDALRYLRGGGASVTLNCGYGRGFSVFEVIEMVKRVSGVKFNIGLTGRRPGDPAQIVAACGRARGDAPLATAIRRPASDRRSHAGMGTRAFGPRPLSGCKLRTGWAFAVMGIGPTSSPT